MDLQETINLMATAGVSVQTQSQTAAVRSDGTSAKKEEGKAFRRFSKKKRSEMRCFSKLMRSSLPRRPTKNSRSVENGADIRNAWHGFLASGSLPFGYHLEN